MHPKAMSSFLFYHFFELAGLVAKEVQQSPQIREGLYIEPNISLILTSDVNQSFRLCIGYPIYGYAFSPQLIGIEGNMGYDLIDFEGNSSYLSVGFGYTYYFNGKKSTALED